MKESRYHLTFASKIAANSIEICNLKKTIKMSYFLLS